MGGRGVGHRMAAVLWAVRPRMDLGPNEGKGNKSYFLPALNSCFTMF